MTKLHLILATSALSMMIFTSNQAFAGGSVAGNLVGDRMRAEVFTKGNAQVGIEAEGDDFFYDGQFRGSQIYSQSNSYGDGNTSVQDLRGRDLISGMQIEADNSGVRHRAYGERIDIGTVIERDNSSVDVTVVGTDISVSNAIN